MWRSNSQQLHSGFIARPECCLKHVLNTNFGPSERMFCRNTAVRGSGGYQAGGQVEGPGQSSPTRLTPAGILEHRLCEHSAAPNACLDCVEILCLSLFSAVNPKGGDARNNLLSDLPWLWGMINDKPLRIFAAKHSEAVTVASWGNKHLV